MEKRYQALLLLLLFIYATSATRPVVTPINGTHQTAVSPNSYTLSFTVNPPVPPGNITWTFRNQLSSNTLQDSPFFAFSSDRLSLHLLVPTDEGTYTLTAYNSEGSGSGMIVLNIRSQPAFQTLPTSQTKYELENVTFPCFATGDPTPTIDWVFNGSLIINSTNEKYRLGEFGQSDFGSLTVYNLVFPDTGVYVCRASNQYTTLQAPPVQLGVQVLPRVTSQPPSRITPTAGGMANITCNVRGFPPVGITWQKNRTNITDISSIARYMLTSVYNHSSLTTTGTLTIRGPVLSTNGNYTCSASNTLKSYRETLSEETQVSVQYPPSTSVSDDTVRVNQTFSSSFSCQSFGIPPPTLNWYRNGNRVESVGVVTVTNSNYTNSSDFLIQRIKLDISSSNRTLHEGNYTCVAVNGITNYIGTSENVTTLLLVQVKPRLVFPDGLSLLGVVATPITLNINIQEASPSVRPHNILWYFSGTLLNETQGYQFSNDRKSLTITSLSHDHEGIYTVIVRNEAGSDTGDINLQIEAAPVIISPPIMDVNVLLNDRATLTCTLSAEPQPVIEWRKEGGGSIDATLPNVTVSFTNGTNQREYMTMLIIDNVTMSDTGDYTCIVVNSHGRTNATGHIEVQIPPTITLHPVNTSGIRMGSTHLTCHSYGSPVPNITWIKGGVEVNPQTTPTISIVSLATGFTGISTILFSNLSFFDASSYTCLAQNDLVSLTSANSSVAILTVNQSPLLISINSLNIVNQSQNINMTCTYLGLPPPVINWTRSDSASLSSASLPNNKFTIYTNQMSRLEGGILVSSTLQINNVGEDDTSNYTCTAFNKAHGEMAPFNITTNTFHVLVQTSPIVRSYYSSPQIGVLTRNISLSFNITRDIPKLIPARDIKWFRNSMELSPDNRHIFSLSRRSLNIINLTLQDEGTYSLQASNIIGSGNDSVYLDVEISPVITNNSGTVQVVQGNNAIFHCAAVSEPVHITNWTFNSTHSITTNSSKYIIYGSNTVNSTLVIIGVELNDGGTYTCRANNVHGVDSAVSVLQVQVPPQITTHPVHTTVLVRNQVELKCCASGIPLPTIVWYKNNTVYNTSGNMVTLSQEGTGINCSTLIIGTPVFTDRGDYSCTAVNVLAETRTVTSSSGTLTVQYPPEVFPLSQVNYTLNESDSLSIECTSFGVPLPSLYWLPGPINVTRNIGNGDYFLLNSELNTLRSRVLNTRFNNLTNVCPYNGLGPSTCHDTNSSNDCSYTGSLCNVPCGVVISDREEVREDGRPVRVSVLTMCNVIKMDELSYTCVAVNNISNGIGTSEGVSANVIVQVKPLVNSADSLIAFRGHNTTLHFNITDASPDVIPQDIKWSFTHQFLSISDNNIVTGSGNHYIFSSNRRSLFLQNLTTNDTGRYTLTASNAAGTSRGTVELVVKALPEIMLFTAGPVITTTGHTISLDCFADGSPLQNVSWTFTNFTGSQVFEIKFIVDNETTRIGHTEIVPLIRDLSMSDISLRFSISNNTYSSDREYGRLTIRDITADYYGRYECTLINEFNINNPETRSVQVQVQLNSSVIASPQSLINCTAGSFCVLTCTVEGVPAPNVTWYHHMTPLSSSLSSVNNTYNQTRSTLTIPGVGLNDAGLYYCRGSNELYSNSSDKSMNGNVTILYPPQVVIPPQNTAVNETFNTAIYCTITGYPAPTIQWTLGPNDNLITNNISKYFISQEQVCGQLCNVTSSLVIYNATLVDETTYTCTGYSHVERLINIQSSATARLTVQVPPTIVNTSTTTTTVTKGLNLTISFNITRASPLVEIDDIVWYFKDLRGNTLTLNVTCAKMGGDCDDNERYSRYIFTFGSLGTRLEIRNAQVMDYGEFTVSASNPGGVSSLSHNLRVNVPALVNTTGGLVFNYTREIGGVVNFTLNCMADGIPRPNILWYFNGVIFSGSRTKTITLTPIKTPFRSDVALHPEDLSVQSVLSITNANPQEDAGLYTCEAVNNVGAPSSLQPPFRVIINVDIINRCLSNPCQNGGTCRNTESGFFCECARDGDTIFEGETCNTVNRVPVAPRLTVRPQAEFVRLFERVELNCAAVGEPTPIIIWFKDGVEIPNARGKGSFSYVIPEINLAHRGQYRCTADNNVPDPATSDSVYVNIIDVVEYTANLTVTINLLFVGANRITRNLTTAVNDIVTGINRRNAGNQVGENSTVFFIERSGNPINLTANFTLPIRVTIRIQEGRRVDDALRSTVATAVAEFGYHIDDSNSVVTIFNYCPPDETIIPSPNGDPRLAITITWPRQILGLSQSVNCPCDFSLSTTALAATRNCTGDFTSGATWERPNIGPCNFSVTTRELCRLANLPSSAIVSGLDTITSETDKIDAAGTTVTSFALESVENDLVDNMTLVETGINVYNNILGVNRTELGIAQASSDSSTRMQRLLRNVTLSLQNTTIIRDRIMIMTGNFTPPVLRSNITNSRGNSSLGQDVNGPSLEVQIPSEVRNMGNSFSFTALSNDGLFIPKTGSPNITSPVMDLTINVNDSGEVNNLETNVTLRFNSVPIEILTDPKVVPTCVFWDENLGDWSTKGCITINGSTCSCNHLTSFAILLDVAADQARTSPEDEAFEYITYIGLTLSTFSLIVTLITYLGSPKLRSSEASQLLINLSFALLGLYITFLIAGLGSSNLTAPVCAIFGILVQYFFLVVFFVMAAESIDLFIKLVIVLGPKIQKFILKTIIIAWIAPLFFVLFSFVPNYEHYVTPHYCGPTKVPLYVGMLLPFCIIYIFNWTIFFIIMISLLRKSASNKFNEAKKKNRKAEVKQQCRVAFTVSVLFGLGWGFGLLASQAVGVVAIQIIFNSIFTVLTVFQGFFIFLLYVLLSPNARKVWKRWILRKDEKSGESTSSAGPSTTRSTKNTSLPNKSSHYGRNARTKGTLYKNVYSAAAKKSSSPYVTRDFISSDLDSSAQPMVEELKAKLQFRSMDEEDDDRVFMNPLDDLGDVMSLVSDNGSLLAETTFSFPQPSFEKGYGLEDGEEEEEEEEEESDALDPEKGKCSTFKNPMRQTIRNTRPKDTDERELLSGNTVEEEASQGGNMTTLNISEINGFTLSDNLSSSLSPVESTATTTNGYYQSQGLSGHDDTFLIKDSQLSEL